MNRMSCSMTTIARPRSRILKINLGLPGLLGVHARCRLIQQQQLGISTESAGNLESPLVPVGQLRAR